MACYRGAEVNSWLPLLAFQTDSRLIQKAGDRDPHFRYFEMGAKALVWVRTFGVHEDFQRALIGAHRTI